MALYHKYRPQKFSDVIGQEHITQTISNQIKSGTVAHAYLFSGPRGIGKTTTARLLAKALNCENRKEGKVEPCDSCNSCKEISGSRSIDVIEIDAASHTGVDNVRENIIENAQFKPTKSPYKVFIIDEVHMLSTSAFNALLKTLEEPPEHVVFILATTELHKLPETIVSRCQRYNFKKVGYDILKKHLGKISKEEKVKIEDPVIDRIINKSDGCIRDAISIMDQIMAVGEKTITAEIASIVLPASQAQEALALITTLINKQTEAGLAVISTLVSEGTRFIQFADDVIELLRVLMIMKATGQKTAPGIDLSDEVKKELGELAKQIEYNDLVFLIDLIMKRRQEIQTSPLPQLPLELALIEWTTSSNEPRSRSHDQGATIKEQETDNNSQSKQPDKNGTTCLAGRQVGQSDNKSNNKKDEDTSPQKEPEPKSRLKDKVQKVKDLVTRDKEPVCTLEQARDKWSELLEAINGDSPSLTFVLKMAQIVDINGNTISITVPYEFHKDKLECKKCRKQIESHLANIFDSKIKLAIEVVEEVKEKEDPELQELASALGGEIVN